jgi:threonine/homoserine/homoserine lactone efflux protein
VVSLDQLLSFGLAAFILIVVPGPSVLFVIGRALAHGRQVAVASVVGNATGVYVVAIVVALGLGTIVERSDAAFALLKLFGAAYLVWLGIGAIRHRRGLESALAAPAPRGRWRALREGFVVGVANPKAVILFGAVLPQFVDRSAGHVPAQMLVLAFAAFLIALVSDTCWAIGASNVRTWFARSPRRLELVGGFGGLAMIGVGVSVALTHRRD